MKTPIILSLAAMLAAACGTSAPSTPIPDTSLGLAKGSVFDVPTPPAVKADESNPGEQPVLARPYASAPPRVPHAVGDFLPITQKQNACLECHAVKEKTKGEPTPIPPSHYVDYRISPERVDPRVVGARYICVSCHAARTDAPDLVGNRFRP